MSEVHLEVGSKKVFACSVDWAGWCRSGKTEEAALEALADYAERYEPITSEHARASQGGAHARWDFGRRAPG